ncbi:hypothetical protein ACTWJ9_33230 (plasmid) [Streptomyces sp. GDS52]|uniref:hypothetical protein n=1 Tax=Streptomyces sp. GDS52 TaxID=3406419 RepID=UPI003FD692F2
MSGALPCRGHEALYDIVLFGDGTPQERQQAVHRAAALCGSCPVPCDQKVTADTAPSELLLLEPGWMPPEREGKPEPEPRMPARRKRARQPNIKVGADYVPSNRRVAAWAEMCADRAALGHGVADIAADLCVSEDTVTQLIALGRKARGWAA